MSEKEMTGFTVAYGRDEAPFPVYVSALLAAVLLTTAIYQSNLIFLGLGAVAAGFAYYNWPLAEIGRPRIGANQYGVFIEGFGILQWRAIDGDRFQHDRPRAAVDYRCQRELRGDRVRQLRNERVVRELRMVHRPEP